MKIPEGWMRLYGTRAHGSSWTIAGTTTDMTRTGTVTISAAEYDDLLKAGDLMREMANALEEQHEDLLDMHSDSPFYNFIKQPEALTKFKNWK